MNFRYFKFSIALIACLSSFIGLSQDDINRISHKKNFFGTTFYHKGEKVTPNDLVNITLDDPNSHAFMTRAKTNYEWSNIFGFIGGGCIGFPIGRSLAGREFQWPYVAVGAVFIALSVPLSIGYTKNAIRGENAHNANLTNSSQHKTEWNLTFNESGLGVSLRF